MATRSEDNVVCAFCGKSLPAAQAVTLVLILSGDETQTIFAHPEHLRDHVHVSVPLHLDILEAAVREASQTPS